METVSATGCLCNPSPDRPYCRLISDDIIQAGIIYTPVLLKSEMIHCQYSNGFY